MREVSGCRTRPAGYFIGRGCLRHIQADPRADNSFIGRLWRCFPTALVRPAESAESLPYPAAVLCAVGNCCTRRLSMWWANRLCIRIAKTIPLAEMQGNIITIDYRPSLWFLNVLEVKTIFFNAMEKTTGNVYFNLKKQKYLTEVRFMMPNQKSRWFTDKDALRIS